MAAKSSGGGFGNAVRDLVRSVTGGGGAETRRAEDKAASAPSYSGMSIKGLTSSDPANVARNQAAVKRINEAEAKRPESKDKKDKPKPATAPAPTPTPLPVVPPPTLTPPGAPAPVGSEAPTSAAEAAAIASAGGGRASTILTSALGLLADAEETGQLRKRRSLMGGGMIQ